MIKWTIVGLIIISLSASYYVLMVREPTDSTQENVVLPTDAIEHLANEVEPALKDTINVTIEPSIPASKAQLSVKEMTKHTQQGFVYDASLDLAQSKQLANYLNRIVFGLIQDKVVPTIPDKELREVEKTVDPIAYCFTTKHWDICEDMVYQALIKFDDHPQKRQLCLTMMTSSLVKIDGSEQLLLSLINMGAEIQTISLLPLINKHKFDRVLQLENLGLDLAALNYGEFTLLDMVLAKKTSQEAFMFLLERVDDINHVGERSQVDTLFIALVNANKNKRFITSAIEQMIAKGAIINPRHLQAMQGLKNESPETYTMIIEQYPQLVATH
ncbi:hypothetical protein [Glaciecola sp. 1036]|uniref:hypothetical protein n=1 Tax=Alteromonadaceae TaxID=72275 RepID=UPI003CFD28B5